MRLNLDNMLSIKHAEIRVNGVTVVAGLNGAGKSTILGVAAVLASRETVHMVDGIGKATVQMGKTQAMVRQGAKSASATMTVGDKSFAMSYPANKSSGELLVKTDPLSCGRIIWSALSSKERQAIIKSVIGELLPTKEQFIASASSVASQKGISDAWCTIAVSGWDVAYVKITQRATELRGQWKGVTNESYGSQKAETWGCGMKPMEELEAAAKAAEKAYNDAIGTNAISEKERQILQETANRKTLPVDEMIKHVALNDATIAKLRKEYDDSQAAFKARIAAMESEIKEDYIRAPTKQSSINCPSCGVSLVVNGNTLVQYSAISDDDLNKIKKHNNEVKKKAESAREEIHKLVQQNGAEISAKAEHISNLQSETIAMRQEIDLCNSSNAAKEAAKKDLESRPMQSLDLPALKKDYNDAVAVVSLSKAAMKAHEIHCDIKDAVALAPIMAPEGLRATTSNSKMSELNRLIDRAAGLLGIKMVMLDENNAVVMDGIPFQFLSEGQKLLADIVMQWAVALHHKPELLIMDRVSLLFGSMRGKVIMNAKTIAPNVLIAITEKKEYVDAISKQEAINGVYWIEHGGAEKVK